MKKSLKKTLSLLLVSVILLTSLLIAPITSYAAESPVTLESANLSIWADAENVLSQADITDFKSGNKLAPLGGIQPFKRSSSSSKYYWFLPSTADCSALTFWFDGTAAIDGTAIASGVPTNIFADINEGGVQRAVTLTLGSSNYSVTVMKSGEVGTVYIDTESGSLSKITNAKNEFGGADTSVFESGSIMVVQPNGKVDYSGVMEKMSGRGNGTWDTGNVKNPYNIKLAISSSLLGMGSAKKWCLLANTSDASLVKNQLTYDFAKYIGIKYQPTCKPVDLYVNQQYLGSYQLSEKVDIKSNRIDISDVYDNLQIANGTTDPETGILIPKDLTGTAIETYNPNKIGTNTYNLAGHTITAKRYSPSLKEPTDYTGGYLYELEISQRWVAENAGFCAYNRQGWVIKNADYVSTQMVNYSYDLLYALGSSVYNKGIVPSTSTTTDCSGLSILQDKVYGEHKITNPAPATQYQGKKWSDILDADSAVRYYWTQEFFKNMDSSVSSTYFFKDSDLIDGKLYAGPMWDMDNSIGYGQSGTRWGYSWTSSNDWYTKNSRIYRWRVNDNETNYSTDKKAPLSFYGALATNCTDFWSEAEKYWYAYISPAVDIISGKAVDETGTLKSAEEYIRTVSKSGSMNAVRLDINNSTYDTESHINGMTNWLNERQTWINSQITKEDLSAATIDPVTDQYYTGYEITPKTIVKTFKAGIGNITLAEGLDYEFSYSNNINVGTANLTVNGAGIYSGSSTKTFNIIKTNISSCTLQIESNAYSNMLLTADIRLSDGRELPASHSYQWYRNGSAITGATEKTYTTTPEDVGATITVTATGDNVNLTGSITSNGCTVLAGSKPTGYTKTIAAWDYDYTADNTALATADPSGLKYYYTATSGENQSDANLYASVDAKNNAQIKWSSSSDLYANSNTSVASDRSPVMGTSKNDLIAWGKYPYFETVVSTLGFEGIKFSANLGGTKKGPRGWKLQYSLDGTAYTDIGSSYTIINNKTMELAFDNIALPQECDNQSKVYIRMVVCENMAINGTSTIINQLSGDASVNNIKVTGSSLKVVTELLAPVITPENGSPVFSDNNITITDSNGGADVYYTINGSEPILYTGEFNPFDAKTAKAGTDSVTISAYAKFEDIVSESVTAEFTFAGVNINSFSYDTYSTEVLNGAVDSNGGVYGESGKMTAYTDGKSQYVPLWNDKNGSFSIAPDDGAFWSENSGFTYKVSTAGYENINFSCMAYTTAQGPKSLTLQYSTDGITYYNVVSDVPLTANLMLEKLFVNIPLPAACSNQRELYIRLATTENMTFGGTELHNNASKGNLYVNNVIVAGEDNGAFKMPYTNKSTSYFGDNGFIKYKSADNLPIQYAVVDSQGSIVQNGICPETGIQLSTVKGFDPANQEPYRVLTWVEEDEESSAVNIQTYYYKGDTVVKFNYNDSTRPFSKFVSSDFLTVSNTSGENSGTLSMYPNAADKAILSYTGTYGVKVAYSDTNSFTATGKLDNPDGNGYWFIETSTLGFKNLTLTLEQLSSNNGPRDWGIAYSTDGRNYKYVENSNARAISNDASSKTIETYSNFNLPAECSNLEKLYIKLFINGGESVDGDELRLVTKGNTGINSVDLSGTRIPNNVTVNTTVLETKTSTTGTYAYSGVDVYVDGVLKGTTDENGLLNLALVKNRSYTITFKGNEVVEKTTTVSVTGDETVNVPLLVFDVNNDGFINAKDYAIINKNEKYSPYKQFFENFINTNTTEFVYS